MPNKWTFQIKPIRELLNQEMMEGLWIDPFAGMNSPATITNDINPEMPTSKHLDAIDFVKQFDDNSVDGVIFDPPYSLTAMSHCYKNMGIKPNMSQSDLGREYSMVKTEISRILKPNGKAICFGWNSNGIGKTRGFELTRILLVAHGSYNTDTIVTVERKIQTKLV